MSPSWPPDAPHPPPGSPAPEAEGPSLSGLDTRFYDQLPEAICICTRDGRLLYLNPAAVQLLGQPLGELLGRIFWEQLPAMVDTPLQHAFQRAALTGEPAQFDTYYANSDRWFSHRIYASGDLIYAFAVDITDQKRADETLRLNSRILESMSEGVCLVDDQGTLLYTNPAWDQMFGYERGELTGTRMTFQNAYPPQERVRVVQELLTHLKTQGKWAGEILYPRKDGTLLNLYVRLTAMELGGRQHYICVHEDITDRKRDEVRRQQLSREVESARAETEAERRRLHQLFTEAPAGIALLQGPQHVYIFSNPLNTELIGTREVMGKPVREALSRAEEQGFISVLDQVYSTGETFVAKEGPAHFRQPDGSMRQEYLDIIVQPTRDAAGEIDGIAVFIFKVTEKVLARQKLEVLAEELRRSEERLRTLVEASSVILWSTDAKGGVVEDSPSWRTYTGQTLERWLAPEGWLEALHPEDRGKTIEAWNLAITHRHNYEVEFRLHRADGTYRYVQSRAVLLHQPDGSPREWFGAITDIHQRKQGELQLQQSIRMRDEFLSVASHELRTPLTPLNLLLHGLQRAASAQPDTPFTQLVTRSAEAGRRQIQRLVQLVEDLLDVSRIAEGRLQPRLEEMDLAALAQEVVSRFELQAATAGCPLELHAPRPVMGQWDRLRLEQVLVNLVDNALKYSPGRPVSLRIETRGDKAVLHVRDEGIGIPHEHQSRIFERFERAVSERHYGGLGLGLFITRQIIRAHGGDIRVESTPGVETTFTVELPLVSSA
ncbi:PAS domain S-box protein [Vitiosangium sp. GDMCC 1.1324]|uniref:PAS domain-containing sensor histidine kinase n=1 Tax=Vitiosangium sp. (strain GDMCC 1.1324) TaxID=2138576 RepID=UPI00130ECDE0|nr:PAS domain S-box protein [Vitiosangium sp. GDMCC 1.1324]